MKPTSYLRLLISKSTALVGICCLTVLLTACSNWRALPDQATANMAAYVPCGNACAIPLPPTATFLGTNYMSTDTLYIDLALVPQQVADFYAQQAATAGWMWDLDAVATDYMKNLVYLLEIDGRPFTVHLNVYSADGRSALPSGAPAPLTTMIIWPGMPYHPPTPLPPASATLLLRTRPLNESDLPLADVDAAPLQLPVNSPFPYIYLNIPVQPTRPISSLPTLADGVDFAARPVDTGWDEIQWESMISLDQCVGNTTVELALTTPSGVRLAPVAIVSTAAAPLICDDPRIKSDDMCQQPCGHWSRYQLSTTPDLNAVGVYTITGSVTVGDPINLAPVTFEVVDTR